jgi:hypothetical protein
LILFLDHRKSFVAQALQRGPKTGVAILSDISLRIPSSFLHVYHAFAVDLKLMEAAFWLLGLFASNPPQWEFLWKAMPRSAVNCFTRVSIPPNALFNMARTQSKRKNVLYGPESHSCPGIPHARGA